MSEFLPIIKGDEIDMRDIKQLHPKLQKKIAQLQELCEKNGIKIGISQCLRTTAEQDALYAKGRTAPGGIVTNAKGSTYSSMHQWGVAFDFYLIMDVDGDGKTSDDAFNNATKLFDKVGKLGQSIGLEWGGSWKSIVDKPHFQLPDWGSTASKLKQMYGKPEKFMSTWGVESDVKVDQTEKAQNVTASKSKTGAAKSKSAAYNKSYVTTKGINLMSGAGNKKDVIFAIPKGSKVRCYGYYTKVGSTVWLYVAYGKYNGFVKKDNLK